MVSYYIKLENRDYKIWLAMIKLKNIEAIEAIWKSW